MAWSFGRGRSAWLAAVALPVALIASSCGGGGDGGAAGVATGSPAEQRAAVERAEEPRIEATLVELREDYNDGAARAWCSKLAAPGLKEVRGFGRAMGHSRRCAPIMTRHFDREHRTGVPPFDIISIIVYRPWAVVTATGGIAGRVPAKLRLIERDGEWRLTNPLSVSAHD